MFNFLSSSLSFLDHEIFAFAFDDNYEVSIWINVFIEILYCSLFHFDWSINWISTFYETYNDFFTQVKSPSQYINFAVRYCQIIFAHSCNKFVMTGTSNKCWQLPITTSRIFVVWHVLKNTMPKSLYWLCSYSFVLLNMLFMMSFCERHSYRIAWVIINYSFTYTRHPWSRGFEY